MTRPYEIIAVLERTPAWWAWRRGGIGSADAASILGDSHAKTAERVLYEKQHVPAEVRRDFLREQSARLERIARAAYNAHVGVSVTPACLQSCARPWQRASVDGLAADGERVVEIKCGQATYQRAKAQGRPPSHHYAQLQHILAVAGLGAIDYWCHIPSQPPLRLEIARDEAYIARLIAAEEIFWRRMSAHPGTSPDAAGGRE